MAFAACNITRKCAAIYLKLKLFTFFGQPIAAPCGDCTKSLGVLGIYFPDCAAIVDKT